MEPIVFYTAATIAVMAVILMIFQSNPVASAIYLVVSFFSLAVLYVTLSAHFVAALQILVYAGAIMVLFVFVIMLLNLREDELVYDRMNLKRAVIAGLGLGLFALIASKFVEKFSAAAPPAFQAVSADFGTAKSVAKILMTEYMIPFEVMGFLLLVGLVGAILLGRREN